jgi:CubicO group peptidase (beta-lactamase class C family)
VTVPPEAVVRSAGWTGGGLEAQADDVARVFRSMFTGALTQESVTAFTTPFRDTGYGLGISVGESAGHTSYSHGGGVPGFRSDAVYLPDLDVTVVVSANLIPIEPDISSLSSAILDLVLERLDG